jgi:hypothetical protein
MKKPKNELLNSLVLASDVRKMFKIARGTECRWRKDGVFGRSIMIGKNRYYFADDLQQMIENRTTKNQQDEKK